jgi:hypothetical protein
MEIYIRFGDCPEGRSINAETGEYEPGVSCYRASIDEWGGISISLPSYGSEAQLNMNLCDRPVYRVEGHVLDQKGSDGEPLIADATLTLMEDVDGTVLPYAVDER